MSIARFSIKRSVTTMMIIISMVIMGLLTLVNLKAELMPSFNFPVARVSIDWTGASPEDMEKLVTEKVEEGLATVEGIKKITTESTLGESSIQVEFEYGVDIDMKVNDIVTAINRVRGTLPEDIDEPRVRKTSNASAQVMLLTLSGADNLKLKSLADNLVTPRLERIEGVGAINVFGGRAKEILVEVDPNKLEAYNLNIQDLYNTLRKSSLNFPTGYIREGGKEFLVKVSSESKTLEDIRNTVIQNENSNTIYLYDVADISIGTEDATSYGRTDGEDNVMMMIQKNDNGNTVTIADGIKEELKKLEPILPDGAKFTIVRDSSIDVLESINAVKNNALLGLVLAAIVLFVFLKDWRATIVVVIAIPVSIIGTFMMFGAKGMTLNIISLMGLALGVGMLVDNSIVVLDNIYRHLTELKSGREEAAELGATEVVVPIIASTATTIAVFLPIVLREGRAKEIYQDMAYSITFSLLASLIIAITFVPMIASKILKKRDTMPQDGKIINFFKEKYIKVLKLALKNKAITIIGTIVLFISIVGYGSKNIGGEFMPATDDGIYSIIAELPSGTDINKANSIAKRIEEIVAADEHTVKYSALINKEAVSLNVDIGDKSERDRSVREIMGMTRKKLTGINDVTINMIPRQAMGRGASKDVELVLSSDDQIQLEYLARLIADKFKGNTKLAEVGSSLLNGNPEYNIILDKEKMKYYGVSTDDLTYITSYQILGGRPISVKSSSDDVDVRVRLKEEFRNSADKLMDIRIKTASGESIKLKDVAYLQIGEGAYGIDKRDKIPVVTISANLASGYDLVSAQNYMQEVVDEIGLPSSVTYSFGGDGESMKEVTGQLMFAFLVSLFLIYFILAAQFESYILPIIVMGSVPLSIIGVYSGLLITGQKTNMMVFVGIIMLAGIVVNNAIVLIDYIKILLEKDYSLMDALIEAGKTRLRPIFMTTMTTVLGMLPLAFGIGQGSEMYIGMAIAVIYGLIFSTLLTLIFIPVLFAIYETTRVKIEERMKDK